MVGKDGTSKIVSISNYILAKIIIDGEPLDVILRLLERESTQMGRRGWLNSLPELQPLAQFLLVLDGRRRGTQRRRSAAPWLVARALGGTVTWPGAVRLRVVLAAPLSRPTP